MEFFFVELMLLIWFIFVVYSMFLIKIIKFEFGVLFFGVKLKVDKFNFLLIKICL